jgi:dihydroorotase
LATQTGARVHFRGLSAAKAVRMLGRSRFENPLLSADVSAHQLHLTEDDVQGFDSNCHLIPPLRTAEDRDALRRALGAGLIDAITSDHQPHDSDAKANPFPSTAPGLSGLETLLPLTLRLVDEGVMDLATALERVTWGPARVLGLRLGRLDPGNSADVCVFDPEQTWTLTAEAMRSQGRNSPFLGKTLKGRVRFTLLAGRLVFQDHDPV